MPKATPENDNRPIHTVRHRSLKATIWRNQTDKGVLYNVIITRSYRDKETNQWRDTHSIGYDDLMNVAALMYEAHAFISGLNAKAASKSTPRPTAKSRRDKAGPLLPEEGPF
jgi:hypothetical protein